MSDEPDDPESAAARLETALDRIARLVAAPRPAPQAAEPVDESALSAEEIADRLDALIVRLRAALGGPGGAHTERLEQG